MSVATIALAYTAVAAGYAALSRRMPAPVVRARPLSGAIAIAAVIAAVAVWPAHDGGALAGVSVALCVTALATLFIVFAPITPRAVWLVATLAPVAAALAVAVG